MKKYYLTSSETGKYIDPSFSVLVYECYTKKFGNRATSSTISETISMIIGEKVNFSSFHLAWEFPSEESYTKLLMML